MDAKSSLRSSVLSTGKQLLRLKRVDTAGLRSAMGQIDTQWAELLTHIPVVQEKLHQVCEKQLTLNLSISISLQYCLLVSMLVVSFN